MGLWARRSPPPLFFSCSHVKCKRVFPITRIDKFSRLFAVLLSSTHRSVNLKHPVSGPHCGGLSGFLGSERNDRWIQQPQGKSDRTSKTYNRAGAEASQAASSNRYPLQQAFGIPKLRPWTQHLFLSDLRQRPHRNLPSPTRGFLFSKSPLSHTSTGIFALWVTCPDAARPPFSFSRPSQCTFILLSTCLFFLTWFTKRGRRWKRRRRESGRYRIKEG